MGTPVSLVHKGHLKATLAHPERLELSSRRNRIQDRLVRANQNHNSLGLLDRFIAMSGHNLNRVSMRRFYSLTFTGLVFWSLRLNINKHGQRKYTMTKKVEISINIRCFWNHGNKM